MDQTLADTIESVRTEATAKREVAVVPITLLLPGESPRLEGQDVAHIERLAEIETPLPPILVDRRTMQVIDGTHRLMATALKGRETIEVEFFDGPPADAFLHAVQANVAHGFPLSQADRRAAANRIMATHPHLSDRTIARIAGLGAKTVAAIRRNPGNSAAQVTARVGRDGRVRPLSSAEGRLRAAALISQYPTASLREVARSAGVSPATASDVRRRLARGEEPAPGHSTTPDTDTNTDTDAHTGTDGPVSVLARSHHAQPERIPPRPGPPNPSAVLEKLVRDPSLRHKEEGRELLRLMQQNAIGPDRWHELTDVVPAHCSHLVGQLARQYAQLWSSFAQALDQRTQNLALPA
jgi:ParB-like chromosome segregation protein Spo0J